MQIQIPFTLDHYLRKGDILGISRIENQLVIVAKIAFEEKKFQIKLKEGQTYQDISELLETKLNKPLGRELVQYIIRFVCKPDNWPTISASEAELKQKAETTDKYKPKYNYANFEQWQSAVEIAYYELHRTVDDNLPQAWPAIEFILSIKAILHIKEITLPYIGIILGPPAGVKSVPLMLLNGRIHTFFTDDFNPRAMVSHIASLPPGMKEGDQHMLNKMKNKFVLAPELAPLFAKREDELRVILSLMTRVADGQGIETDSGLGHKGVTGKVQFVMGGAAVEFPPRVYAMLSNFGPKLYFFRLPEVTKSEDEYFRDLKGDQFTVKFQRMKEDMNYYLDIFESCPSPEAQKEEGLPYYLPKISLDKFRIDESDEALHIIVSLGKLLRRLRAVAWTRAYTASTKKTTREGDKEEIIETEDSEYSFNTNLFEEQGRANRQHYNLALGHALSMGRACIAMEDIPIITRVTLSTAPLNRHRVFEELLKKEGAIITTREIQDALHIHKNTAKKTMTELVAVGLVHWETVGEEHSNAIVLEDEFEWFARPDFAKAQEDNQRRYHEYLETD
jgi:hypothetical protein